MESHYKEKLKNIKVFIFDVDGVLTNGDLFIFPNGKLVRKMNAKDGYALKLAMKKGYEIAIITGGREKEIEERLSKLGIKHIFLNSHNKISVMKDFLKNQKFKKEDVMYMGDDIPDMEVLQYVGLSCCPNDAVTDVKNICKYISYQKGGDGCVRDIIEQTLRVTDNWDLDGQIKY
jgi:3-deoxy-D-manno-octulosonate 8-phosphate phosphatase (KDO 8-P phosphatase)